MLAALFFGGSMGPPMIYLERKGRRPRHIYLDYSIANFIAAVMFPLTFGQIGDSKPAMPNFFTQLSQVQDNWPSVLIAMASGLALSLGNVVSQYAWAFVGLSVTNIVMCSMIVVIGKTMNYFLDGRINRAEILFPGAACFLIAVFLGTAVHSSNAKDKEEKLGILAANGECSLAFINVLISLTVLAQVKNDASMDGNVSSQAKPGSAEFILQVEKRRSIKVIGSNRLLGLGLVFFAGLCFSVFSPTFNLATNDQWHVLKKGVSRLVVYTAFFYFSVSGLALGIFVNIWFLYRPVAGVPASTIGAYLRDWNGRHWALLAGLLCGLCNGLQFMGGQAAGLATADALQAAPLVSTFWDILLFGEYRRSSRRTYILHTSMLTMFVIAVAVLLASAGHRKTS
ncbi:hypothetical protein HU200_060835 [Digitaria exilis]|uniref:Ureide permease n=1 Tax=Digitaria exilis TaxID=1010633 RepID=A0A835ADQ8_9POAL|nr:hypothetical protein HU200_060835 [Digitaria exilis]